MEFTILARKHCNTRTAKLNVEFLQHKVHNTSWIQTQDHAITVQYPHFNSSGAVRGYTCPVCYYCFRVASGFNRQSLSQPQNFRKW